MHDFGVLREDVLSLTLYGFLLLFNLHEFPLQRLTIQLNRLSLSLNRQLEVSLLLFIPFRLLLYHVVVNLAPELTQLVKLLNLRVHYLYVAVLTQAMLIAVFSLFYRAIAATAPRAVVAVVPARDENIKLSVAELAIVLVLHWLIILARGLLHCCNQSRVQRVYVRFIHLGIKTILSCC